MRVAITGTTGMLGRDLLAEIVRRHLDDPDGIEVFVLGRGEGGRTLRQRVDDLADDCAAYAGVTRGRRADLAWFLRRRVECVETHLERDRLGIAPDALERMRRGGIDHLFHLAALTDFRSTPQVKATLERMNVEGTRQILALADAVGVRQLAYVGSAYSAGVVTGRVEPDHESRSGQFRNHYELTKAIAERHVRVHATERGLRVRCFRPSTIGGRLMEQPDGAIGGFKVFYAWGAYFLRVKAKLLGVDPDRAYEPTVRLPVRYFINPAAGLNIVPVDFAAKAIYAACLDEAPGDAFHVVNDAETPHVLYLGGMIRLMNLEGVVPVAAAPVDPNAAEAGYYRTVGKIFTPYITPDPIDFTTETIRPVLQRNRLRCPRVDGDALARLLAFARRHDFGLESGEAVSPGPAARAAAAVAMRRSAPAAGLARGVLAAVRGAAATGLRGPSRVTRPQGHMVVEPAQAFEQFASHHQAPSRARDQEALAGTGTELAGDAPGLISRMTGLMGLAPELAEVRVQQVVDAGQVRTSDDGVERVAPPELLGECVQPLDCAEMDRRGRRLQLRVQQVGVDERPVARSSVSVDEDRPHQRRG